MVNSAKPSRELSSATRYRQHAAIRQYLNISPFYGKKGRLVAVRAAQEAALIVQQRVDLVNAIIDELVRQQYELPAYSTLENIADVVASAGESKLISLVDSRLSDRERAALDALLAGQAVSQRSPFDRIKQSPRRLSRTNMEALIYQLTCLEGLGDASQVQSIYPNCRIRRLKEFHGLRPVFGNYEHFSHDLADVPSGQCRFDDATQHGFCSGSKHDYDHFAGSSEARIRICDGSPWAAGLTVSITPTGTPDCE
jgi:hypothetical protein